MKLQIPSVSVIIPVYKNWNQLEQCLDALSKQTYARELFEIIVVNNSPHDPSPILLGDVKLMAEPIPGSYAARNKGISAAVGHIIAFTDADCVPDENWLKESVKLITQKNADRIAGKIIIPFLNANLSAVEAYQKALSFNQKRLVKVGLSVTANLICKRKAFDVAGLFNSDLLSGGDWEWSRRANVAGLNLVYGETAIVKHPARSNWAELLKKSRRVNSSRWTKKPFPLIVAKALIHFLMGFIPPTQRGIEIILNEELTLVEKMKAWSVCYVLKIYGHTIRLFSCIHLIEPSRD